jgi:hypothetical protein
MRVIGKYSRVMEKIMIASGTTHSETVDAYVVKLREKGTPRSRKIKERCW